MSFQKKLEEVEVKLARSKANDKTLPVSENEISNQKMAFGDAVLIFIKRLLIGALVWVAVAFFLFLSAIPYGGGGSNIIGILRILTIGIPIWASWPIFGLLSSWFLQNK